MQTLINTKVPDFKVQAFHKGDFRTVTQNELKGKWSIFFFYPADFTFVCPTELGDMADKYEEFQKLGVEVYGVSTDTHFTHKAWHDASETIKKIKYPMLADPTGQLTRAFGVHIEEEGLAYRGTFLINPEGQIKLAEVQDNGIGRNADELYRKVQAAQYIAKKPRRSLPCEMDSRQEHIETWLGSRWQNLIQPCFLFRSPHFPSGDKPSFQKEQFHA